MSSSPQSTTLLTPPPVRVTRTGRVQKPIQRFGEMVDSDVIEVPDDEDERYDYNDNDGNDESYDAKAGLKACAEDDEGDEEDEEMEDGDDGSEDEVRIKKPKKAPKSSKAEDSSKKKREMKLKGKVEKGKKAPVSSSARSGSSFTASSTKKIIPLWSTRTAGEIEIKVPVKKPAKAREPSQTPEEEEEKASQGDRDEGEKNDEVWEDEIAKPAKSASRKTGPTPSSTKPKEAVSVGKVASAAPAKVVIGPGGRKKSSGFVPIQPKKSDSTAKAGIVKGAVHKAGTPKAGNALPKKKAGQVKGKKSDKDVPAGERETGNEIEAKDEDDTQEEEGDVGDAGADKGTKKSAGKSVKQPRVQVKPKLLTSDNDTGGNSQVENVSEDDNTQSIPAEGGDNSNAPTPKISSQASHVDPPNSLAQSQFPSAVDENSDEEMQGSDEESEAPATPTPTDKKASTSKKTKSPASSKKRKRLADCTEDVASQFSPKKKPAMPEKVTTPFRLAIMDALTDASYTKTIDFRRTFGAESAKLSRHWREVLSVDLRAAFGGPGAKAKAATGSITSAQRAKIWKIVCESYDKADWQRALEKGQDAVEDASGLTVTKLKRHFRDVMRKEGDKVIGK